MAENLIFKDCVLEFARIKLFKTLLVILFVLCKTKKHSLLYFKASVSIVGWQGLLGKVASGKNKSE